MALVTCPTCPCAFRLRRLAQNEKSCQEISYGDLVQNSSEILPRDLLQRFCQQSSYIEFLRRGLARRFWEILRDLERSWEQRSCSQGVHRRSTQKIFVRDLKEQDLCSMFKLSINDLRARPLLSSPPGLCTRSPKEVSWHDLCSK